jgi:hypothetical protein
MLQLTQDNTYNSDDTTEVYMPDPDKTFEKLVHSLVPIWGPFYALFYIVRLLWREFRHKRQS